MILISFLCPFVKHYSFIIKRNKALLGLPLQSSVSIPFVLLKVVQGLDELLDSKVRLLDSSNSTLLQL